VAGTGILRYVNCNARLPAEKPQLRLDLLSGIFQAMSLIDPWLFPANNPP
jgi:hypothetical protein